VDAAAFGHCLTVNGPRRITITFSLHALLACYLLLISYFAISQTDVTVHWKTLIHVSIISTVAFSVLLLNSILPIENGQISLDNPILSGLWYTTLAMHTIGMLIAINIPGGPSLHCDPAILYNNKTLDSIVNQDYDNVSGVTGMNFCQTVPPVLSSSRLLCLVIPYVLLYYKGRYAWKYR
jgi:hypothetical protein